MNTVTKKEFFKAVGHLDVHPSIRHKRYDNVLGYESDWKLRNGDVIGYTCKGIYKLAACVFAKATGGQ